MSDENSSRNCSRVIGQVSKERHLGFGAPPLGPLLRPRPPNRPRGRQLRRYTGKKPETSLKNNKHRRIKRNFTEQSERIYLQSKPLNTEKSMRSSPCWGISSTAIRIDS